MRLGFRIPQGAACADGLRKSGAAADGRVRGNVLTKLVGQVDQHLGELLTHLVRAARLGGRGLHLLGQEDTGAARARLGKFGVGLNLSVHPIFHGI